MSSEGVKRGAQLIARTLPSRAAAKYAPNALRRFLENLLKPPVKRLVGNCFSLVFRGHCKERINPRLDWPLVKNIAAKAVYRPDPREFQLSERLIQSVALNARCLGARPLD